MLMPTTRVGLISFRKMASTMMASAAPTTMLVRMLLDDDGDVVALIGQHHHVQAVVSFFQLCSNAVRQLSETSPALEVAFL